MNCVKIEIRKAVGNLFFWISLACLMLFSLFSASFVIQNYLLAREYLFPEQIRKGINEFYPIWNFYQNWIGAERISMASSLFFTLLPVFAVLPAALSFQKERRTDYLRVAVFRTGKRQYVLAKSVAVFLSGFLVAFLPLIANVLLVSAFIPTTIPQVNYNFYTYVSFGELWADLFFFKPWIYVGLYVLLDSLFAGLLALMGFAFSFFIRYGIVASLTPFFLCMAVDYAVKVLDSIGSTVENSFSFELSPFGWMRASHIGLPVYGWVVAAELLLFTIFSLSVIFLRGSRDELY